MFTRLLFAQPVNVDSSNLKELLETRNARVHSAKFSKGAAESREGFLKRSFMPSVSVYGGQETFRSGTLSQRSQPVYGAEVSVNLFNSGRDRIENQVRELETEKRQFQIQRVTSEELEKARATYWQVLYLKEKVRLLKEVLKVNKQNLSDAMRRIKGGVATNTDRFEFEMKDVDLKRELAEAEVQFLNQKRYLSVQLGVNDVSTLDFKEEFFHDHQSDSDIGELKNRYEFLIKEAEIQSQQYALSSEDKKRSWWPKLDAFAAYNQYNQRVDSAGTDAVTQDMRRDIAIGLKLSMNIPSGFEANREADSMAKEQMATNSLVEYQKKEIEMDLLSDISELKLMHDLVHEAEENIGRAQRYYSLTQSEYKRGVKNSPDVLGAAEKLFNMKNRRLEIIKNYQVAKSHILSKLGQ